MKKVKKIVTLTLAMGALMSTVAFAGWDSTSFNFTGKTGKGYLHGTFKLTDRDTAWAETSHPGASGYQTATYIEAQGKNLKDQDWGATYSVTDTIGTTGVSRFNSTHGMVANNAVYTWLTYGQCTDG